MSCPLVITGVELRDCDNGSLDAPAQNGQPIPLGPCVEVDVSLNAFPVDQVEWYYVSLFGGGRRLAAVYDSPLPRAIFTWFVSDDIDGWLIITAQIGDCATVFVPLRVRANNGPQAVVGLVNTHMK